MVSASEEWLYYKEYPWVWDNKTEDWLYLRGGEDEKIYAYRNSTKEWEEFNVQEEEKTWDEQYEEWIKDPEPYGGLEVLGEIKEAKDSGATAIYLQDNNITYLTPLAGLINLTSLVLFSNNISELTPLAGLTNLTYLDLYNNNISDLTPLAGLTNLTSLGLGHNNINYLTSLAGLTNLTELDLSHNIIIDIKLLENLTSLNALWLHDNNITDLSPLAGLSNLTGFYLYNNNISDLTPLAGLTNLYQLDLNNNPITASQKAMLEDALPTTSITWPDVIIDDILDTTPPEITILSYSGDWPSYNDQGGEFPTFSYSAIDNVDGDLTDQVEVTHRFSSQDAGGGEEGWAEVIFTVTDASGNITIHHESGPVEPIGFLEVP